MFIIILKVIYFGLPAIIANSLPVIFAKFRWLEIFNKPVDNNYLFYGQPLCGRRKTWRGFIVGIIGGLIIIFGQRYLNRLSHFLKSISLINYESQWLFWAGFLLSFGALFGDLVKSFIKRRFKVVTGKKWWPWDNLDSTLGALFFISFYIKLEWQIILVGIIIGPLIHVLSNLIGYKLKLKDVWW